MVFFWSLAHMVNWCSGNQEYRLLVLWVVIQFTLVLVFVGSFTDCKTVTVISVIDVAKWSRMQCANPNLSFFHNSSLRRHSSVRIFFLPQTGNSCSYDSRCVSTLILIADSSWEVSWRDQYFIWQKGIWILATELSRISWVRPSGWCVEDSPHVVTEDIKWCSCAMSGDFFTLQIFAQLCDLLLTNCICSLDIRSSI